MFSVAVLIPTEQTLITPKKNQNKYRFELQVCTEAQYKKMMAALRFVSTLTLYSAPAMLA